MKGIYMTARIRIVGLIALLSFSLFELSQELVTVTAHGKETHVGGATLVEFKNGQFGIILRDASDGNPPSKEIPMAPDAYIPSPPIGGIGSISISNSVPSLQIGEKAHVSLTKGVEVGYLDISGSAEVQIEEGAKVAHVYISDSATLRISVGAEISHVNGKDKALILIHGGTLGFLNLDGQSQAHIHDVSIRGGMFIAAGASSFGGGIIYAPETRIHVYATSVAFRGGKISGMWNSGEHFSISLIRAEPLKDYETPIDMPQQVVAHTLIKASFDCAKTVNHTEKMICGDPVLANLDLRLSIIYVQALQASSDTEQVKASQRRWLRTIRNGCGTAPCMKSAYERRIVVLGKMSRQSK